MKEDVTTNPEDICLFCARAELTATAGQPYLVEKSGFMVGLDRLTP